MSNFIFDTQNPDGTTSLYATGGTAAGTVNLDMSRFGAFTLGTSPDFTALDGKLYFIGTGTNGPEAMSEIFSTDGTVAGTTATPVTGTGGYVAPQGLWVLNNLLLTSGTGKNGSSGLYANGVAIESGRYVANQDALVVSHGLGIFAATSSQDNSTSMWRTDGTAAGTYSITPKGTTLDPGGFTSVGNGKTVFANQAADGTSTLWVTDGTSAGTHRVANTALGTDVTLPGATTNGKAIFNAVDAANNISVWASDGTASGTVELAISGTNGNMVRSSGGFQAFGKDVIYSNGYLLVVTDGTAKGTVSLSDSSYGAQDYVVLGSKIIFNAYNLGKILPGDGATALFVSDGTNSGTHQIMLPYGLNVDSTSMVVSGSQVVFNAVNAAGQEALYTTDGTVSGTKALALPAGIVTSSSEPLAALPLPAVVPPPLTGLLPHPLHVGAQTVTGTGGVAGLQLERITQGTYNTPGSTGWVKATVASNGNWSAVLTFTKPGMLAHVYAENGGSQKVVDLVDGTPTMAAAVKEMSGAVAADMSARGAATTGAITVTSPVLHVAGGALLDVLSAQTHGILAAHTPKGLHLL